MRLGDSCRNGSKCSRCGGSFERQQVTNSHVDLSCASCGTAVGYALTHWSIKLARFAYRLERATAKAIELVQMEDHASWHYNGRPLRFFEELACWSSGFKEGWISASGDGHPWFKLLESDSNSNMEQPQG